MRYQSRTWNRHKGDEDEDVMRWGEDEKIMWKLLLMGKEHWNDVMTHTHLHTTDTTLNLFLFQTKVLLLRFFFSSMFPLLIEGIVFLIHFVRSLPTVAQRRRF